MGEWVGGRVGTLAHASMRTPIIDEQETVKVDV